MIRVHRRCSLLLVLVFLASLMASCGFGAVPQQQAAGTIEAPAHGDASQNGSNSNVATSVTPTTSARRQLPSVGPSQATASPTTQATASPRAEPSASATSEPSASLFMINFKNARAEQEHANKILDHMWSNFYDLDQDLTHEADSYNSASNEQKQALADQSFIFADAFAKFYNPLVDQGMSDAAKHRLVLQELDQGLMFGAKNWATELAQLTSLSDPCKAQPTIYVFEDNAVAREKTAKNYADLLEAVASELQYSSGDLIGGSDSERLVGALRATYIMRKVMLNGYPVRSEDAVYSLHSIASLPGPCLDDPKVNPDTWEGAMGTPPTPTATIRPINSDFPLGHTAYIKGDRSHDLWTAANGGERHECAPKLYPGAAVSIMGMEANAVRVQIYGSCGIGGANEGWIHEPPADVLTADPTPSGLAAVYVPGARVRIAWPKGLRYEDSWGSRHILPAGSLGTIVTSSWDGKHLRGFELYVKADSPPEGYDEDGEWLDWYYDDKILIEVVKE